MPLLLPQPPAAAASQVTGKLRQYIAPEVANPAALGGSNTGELALSSPHETYVLGLDELAADRPLEAARSTGWRYLLQEGGQAVAAAETVETGAGEHRFAMFNSGPFVAATVDSLEAAARLPQVADRDMEPRLLKIPGLNLVALWLHGPDDDVLLPLAPAPTGIEAGRAYSAAELVEALREPASRVAGIGLADERGS